MIVGLARVVAAAIAAAALLAAAPAAAQQSPRRGSFEFRVTPYRPDIDSEFFRGPTGRLPAPYEDAFGGGRRYMFRIDAAKTMWRPFGSLDLGIGAGYFQARGRGRLPDGSRSADPTSLRIIPTSVHLTYRFDVLAERYSIPLAPYGRIGFERYNWWVTKGSGGTASAEGRSGSGATNGYSAGGGIAFLLDIIDSRLAIEMDRDTGINDSYLYVEAMRTKVDDFGSDKSMNLSPDNDYMFSGGLLFVF